MSDEKWSTPVKRKAPDEVKEAILRRPKKPIAPPSEPEEDLTLPDEARFNHDLEMALAASVGEEALDKKHNEDDQWCHNREISKSAALAAVNAVLASEARSVEPSTDEIADAHLVPAHSAFIGLNQSAAQLSMESGASPAPPSRRFFDTSTFSELREIGVNARWTYTKKGVITTKGSSRYIPARLFQMEVYQGEVAHAITAKFRTSVLDERMESAVGRIVRSRIYLPRIERHKCTERCVDVQKSRLRRVKSCYPQCTSYIMCCENGLKTKHIRPPCCHPFSLTYLRDIETSISDTNLVIYNEREMADRELQFTSVSSHHAQDFLYDNGKRYIAYRKYPPMVMWQYCESAPKGVTYSQDAGWAPYGDQTSHREHCHFNPSATCTAFSEVLLALHSRMHEEGDLFIHKSSNEELSELFAFFMNLPDLFDIILEYLPRVDLILLASFLRSSFSCLDNNCEAAWGQRVLMSCSVSTQEVPRMYVTQFSFKPRKETFTVTRRTLFDPLTPDPSAFEIFEMQDELTKPRTHYVLTARAKYTPVGFTFRYKRLRVGLLTNILNDLVISKLQDIEFVMKMDEEIRMRNLAAIATAFEWSYDSLVRWKGRNLGSAEDVGASQFSHTEEVQRLATVHTRHRKYIRAWKHLIRMQWKVPVKEQDIYTPEDYKQLYVRTVVNSNKFEQPHHISHVKAENLVNIIACECLPDILTFAADNIQESLLSYSPLDLKCTDDCGAMYSHIYPDIDEFIRECRRRRFGNDFFEETSTHTVKHHSEPGRAVKHCSTSQIDESDNLPPVIIDLTDAQEVFEPLAQSPWD